MKKIIILLLIIAVPLILAALYFMDKHYLLCPIEYKDNIIIRQDAGGDGFFAASRNGRRIHEGIDLYAPIRTPVLAARSGRVVAATRNRGMGNYIVIRHSDGLKTIYGHLTDIFVKKNSYVRQGQIIGSVGKTGNARSNTILPHLHFELRKDGVPQDPLTYL